MEYIEVKITKTVVISSKDLPELANIKNKRELFKDENEALLEKLEKLAKDSDDCEEELEFNDDVW